MLQPPIFLLRTIVFSLLLFPLESVTQPPPSLSVIAIFKQLSALAIPGAQQFKDMRISTDTALTEQNLNHALALIGKYRDTLNQETYELLKAQITKKLAILRQHRAPRPPLDTGDESSTGDVGDTFEPVSASGFVLPDDVNVVHNLTVGNDATVNGNLVVNGGLVFHGDIVLEPTCPDPDIAIRFNTCTGTEIARIYTPSVVGGLAISTNSGVTENFRVQADGNSQTTGNLTITGVTYANGGVDRSTAAVLNVGTVNATGVNIGTGAATTDINIGSGTTTTVDMTSITTSVDGNTTLNLGTGTATDINLGRLGATTLDLLGVTTSVNGNPTLNLGTAATTTDINIGSGTTTTVDMTGVTTSVDGNTTLNLGNTTATTLNMGTTASTDINIGRAGTTTLDILGTTLNVTGTTTAVTGSTSARIDGLTVNVGNTLATGINIGTTAATTVTIGNVANTTALELPYGYVTTGGSSYINNFGTSNSFFAGLYAGNTAVANTGISNTGIGSNALPSITTGNENTAIGAQALLATTTGSANTACGSAALTSTTGSNNVGVGYHAGMSATSGNNNIYLGYSETGVAGESNTIRLGANATLAATRCFIGGIDGTALGSQAKLVGIVSKQLGTTDASGFTLGGTLYTDSGIDTITATALNIGTTNATSVNLGTGAATATVTIGNAAATTALELPYGYVTKGGNRYINSFGASNSFFAGTNAGSSAVNNLGAANVGVGVEALTNLSGGYWNTAVGYQALTNNNLGIKNTAVGKGALAAMVDREENTAIGYLALSACTNGIANTVIGCSAGNNITAGSNNTYIGAFTGLSVGNEDYTIRISDTATRCFIGGIAGAGPFANAVTINPADGQLGGLVSSRRYKENITPLDSQDRFMQLNPVSFTYKNDAEKSTWYGLIAEEVEPVYPELAIYGKDKQLESVAYLKLYGILIKELQTALTKIALLNKTAAKALEQIETLEAKVAILEGEKVG